MNEQRKGGRVFEGTKGVTVRMTPEEQEILRRVGGSDYIRRHLREIAAGAPFSVRPRFLDDAGRAAFMEGVKAAGFSLPSFPFVRSRAKEAIAVHGLDPREWGRQWAQGPQSVKVLK